jgi:hypothetical protein
MSAGHEDNTDDRIPYSLWARRALAREAPSDRDLTAPSAAASILLIPTVHVASRLVLGRKRPAAVRTRRPPMMSASAGRKL